MNLLDEINPGVHIQGWAAVQEYLHTGDGVNLISFMSQFQCFHDVYGEDGEWDTLSKKVFDWVGIDHMVNDPPVYYRKMWPQQMHNAGEVLTRYNDFYDTCRGLIFMSKHQLETMKSSFSLLDNIPCTYAYHPIIKHPGAIDFDFNKYKENPTVVQLGWSMRNHSTFERVEIPNHNKLFMFGSKGPTCYKLKAYLTDLEHNNCKPSVPVLPFLEAEQCNEILSGSVVFLNLYDAVANNGVIDCIERKTPLFVNRLPSVEEYLGKDYPLFYDSIYDVKGMFDRIEDASDYLGNIREEPRFKIETLESTINEIYSNSSSR